MVILASIVGGVALLVVGAVSGAIGVTLFYRRNAAKQAQVNVIVDKAATKL
jgi:hypothetical protein